MDTNSTEVKTQDKANKQEKMKVSINNLKVPSVKAIFEARVTCQRRS